MPHGDAPDRGGADPCGDGPPEGPPEGWRGVFLTALRETGNVSAAAVLACDWDRAAAEALDSRWASQTGRRAAEVAALLRTR
ncbi:MAG: hypothetical protein VXW25_09205 [Pseudomonadota bacterium]|nr:hypothetical protein [Pseudomonadota bacterium]